MTRELRSEALDAPVQRLRRASCAGGRPAAPAVGDPHQQQASARPDERQQRQRGKREARATPSQQVEADQGDHGRDQAATAVLPSPTRLGTRVESAHP
jgi:hypothetical protein